MSATYRCPLCKSVLTKATFVRVTNIEAGKLKALHAAHEREAFLKHKIATVKKEVRAAKANGLRQGQQSEKRRSERLVKGVNRKLEVAYERIQQLERGTTPQTDGLEFEDRLHARLVREFSADHIVLEGKGGDVLHTIHFQAKPAGLILYECKRTAKIDRQHVEQAMRDKRTRQADFAILVTTGIRKGFTGLGRDGPVLIVAPLGVVPLVSLIRAHLIEVAKAKLSREQRARIATALLDYIISPVFKIPLEEAMVKTRRAQEVLIKEIRDHFGVWQERSQLYQIIAWDVNHISDNLERVLEGMKPLPLIKSKPEPLRLPAFGKGQIEVRSK